MNHYVLARRGKLACIRDEIVECLCNTPRVNSELLGHSLVDVVLERYSFCERRIKRDPIRHNRADTCPLCMKFELPSLQLRNIQEIIHEIKHVRCVHIDMREILVIPLLPQTVWWRYENIRHFTHHIER